MRFYVVMQQLTTSTDLERRAVPLQ